MSLSEEQKNEVLKLKKIAKQYEGIIRTSRSADQQLRAKKDLKKVLDQIELIAPGGLADSVQANDGAASIKKDAGSIMAETNILRRYPAIKIHPIIEDTDINLLHTILHIWETEYSITVGDSHIKLDFSSSMERDTHFGMLENIKRQRKILIESIDDFSRATREDVKAQLREMKSRYSRHFLKEGYMFLKSLHDFWRKVSESVTHGTGDCLNPEDTIDFDPRFEISNRFEGWKVIDFIKDTSTFLSESVSVINVPEF